MKKYDIMEYDKPKVIIDLEEYHYLLALRDKEKHKKVELLNKEEVLPFSLDEIFPDYRIHIKLPNKEIIHAILSKRSGDLLKATKAEFRLVFNNRIT